METNDLLQAVLRELEVLNNWQKRKYFGNVTMDEMPSNKEL